MIVAYKLVSTQFVRRSDRVKDHARPGLYRSVPSVIGRDAGIARKENRPVIPPWWGSSAEPGLKGSKITLIRESLNGELLLRSRR
jgi:hypothetical protein